MATGDLIGKTLGKCRILGRLGHGRTSSIYRAHYEPLNKQVAVKILRKDAKASPELREKFMNEARALAKLDHPNIVKVYDVVEEGPFLFIIMELLDGEDLLQVLTEDGHMDAEEAVDIVARVARALGEAHRQQIVHRDVKPANIILAGPRGSVKLVDFGLATGGITGGKAGTPHYMSPEQIQGKKVTEKSDIYALGATFFHMLTGQPPYPAKTAKVIREKHVEGNLPTPSRIGRQLGVPKAVDPVVKRMMAPVAGYRFPAKELSDTLDALNLDSSGRRKKTRSARAASRRGKNLPLIVSAVVVGLVLIGAGIFFALPDKEPEKTDEPVKDVVDKPTNGGPINTIKDRASEARKRIVLSENELRHAKAFESSNFGKDREIYDRYKKIWDEYGDTGAGEKAREKMKEYDKRIRAEEIAAEKKARDAKLAKVLPALEKDLVDLRKKFDFAGMNERILKFLDDHELDARDEKPWFELINRLEYADKFIVALGDAITENPRKYDLTFFKKDGPKNAKIISGNKEGVIIREGTLDRKREWGYFKAEELGRIASRMMSSRDAMTYYLLANFYFVLGMKDDAESNLENAIGMDQTGEYKEREKRVKKGK
jgi:serine/threonine protein kinase